VYDKIDPFAEADEVKQSKPMQPAAVSSTSGFIDPFADISSPAQVIKKQPDPVVKQVVDSSKTVDNGFAAFDPFAITTGVSKQTEEDKKEEDGFGDFDAFPDEVKETPATNITTGALKTTSSAAIAFENDPFAVLDAGPPSYVKPQVQAT